MGVRGTLGTVHGHLGMVCGVLWLSVRGGSMGHRGTVWPWGDSKGHKGRSLAWWDMCLCVSCGSAGGLRALRWLELGYQGR